LEVLKWDIVEGSGSAFLIFSPRWHREIIP
jgi:hypothetical protein